MKEKKLTDYKELKQFVISAVIPFGKRDTRKLKQKVNEFRHLQGNTRLKDF